MKPQQTGPVKRFKTALLVTFFLGIISLWYALGISQTIDHDVKIVAHRGGIMERPENTISAFKRAVELGSDIIEIDLRTSKDGQLFILHDATLDRTTNESGPAADLTLDELQKLDAGSWFDPLYSEEKIPSFKEVLEWVAEKEVGLLLDLKESGREFAESVAGEIQTYGAEEKIVIGVRTPVQAQEFRELLPRSRQLAFMGSQHDIDAYAGAGVNAMRLWLRWLEEEPLLASQVRETGTKLMVNGTAGNLDEVKVLMKFSPDWILIDNPGRLTESLHKLQ